MTPLLGAIAGFLLVLLAYLLYDLSTGSAPDVQQQIQRRLGAIRASSQPKPTMVARPRPRLPSLSAFNVPREEDLFRQTTVRGGIRYALGERLAYRLAEANIPFRVGQYVLSATGFSLGLGLIGATFVPSRPGPGFAIGFIAGIVIAYLLVTIRVRRRVADFVETLPDALSLLSSALRSGQALPSGLQLVADEMPEPIGPEFAKVVHEIGLGLPESDALQNLNERIDSVHVKMFVTSVLVQREVGGNLAEILDNTADTIRKQFKIQGQVESYTSVARLSAMILVFLPILLTAAVQSIRPDYIRVLFADPRGHLLLAMAFFAWVVGFVWIRFIMAIRV